MDARSREVGISLQTFGGPDGGVPADYDLLIDALGALQDENFEPTDMIDTLPPSARWTPHPLPPREVTPPQTPNSSWAVSAWSSQSCWRGQRAQMAFARRELRCCQNRGLTRPRSAGLGRVRS
jgi:hypothetical protein